MSIAGIGASLATHGLSLRGGFDFEAGEAAPPCGGRAARSVLLVGNVGGAFWPRFSAWRERQGADLPDPLDAWSRSVIDPLAARFGGVAAYPFDRPHLPFQSWAVRAEGLRASPLGILMHPEFGLWHAYRGALLFPHPLDLPGSRQGDHPCDRCAEKPCMTACPVDAHTGGIFAYEACLAWAGGEHGEPCRMSGCLDRNACPVAAEHRYPAAMQSFLMSAFLRAGRASTGSKARI